MSGESMRGPGGLVLFEAGVDPARLDLSGGPADWTHLPAMGLREFVEAHLVDDPEAGPDAQRVAIFLDAPRRTDTRAAAALACARDLITRGRRVAVVDGDDLQPDLSGWAGRLETEGWVDVVRYGVSPASAGVPLPWGPGDGRIMGVGSYHPVRAEAGEAQALVDRLLADVDTVLICASTGDRGAHWAELDAVRALCWDRARADATETALQVTDAAQLGAPLDATLAFGTAVAAGEPETAGVEAAPPRRSSPVFRRMAILMTVLVVVLGSWFLGQMMRQDAEPVEMPTDEGATMGGTTPVATAPVDTAAADTVGAVAVADTIDVATQEDAPDAAAAPPPVVVDAGPAAETAATDWRTPVLDGDFCLHVYSMADSAMAAEQLRFMDRRGVDGLVRRWRDADEKVWYRIYAGSFVSLGEAREALPDLYERLDTDWALPKRTARIR